MLWGFFKWSRFSAWPLVTKSARIDYNAVRTKYSDPASRLHSNIAVAFKSAARHADVVLSATPNKKTTRKVAFYLEPLLRLELRTFALQKRCSTNWAKAACVFSKTFDLLQISSTILVFLLQQMSRTAQYTLFLCLSYGQLSSYDQIHVLLIFAQDHWSSLCRVFQ